MAVAGISGGRQTLQRAAAGEHRQRALIVDVDEGTGVMRPPAQAQQRGAVVRLDLARRFGADLLDHLRSCFDITSASVERTTVLPAVLSRAATALEIIVEQRRALEADDLAEIDGRDRRLVGDAEIEIAPALRLPVEQHRPQRQLALVRLHAHLHRLPGKAPSVSRRPSVSANRLAKAASRPAMMSSTALRKAPTTDFT